MSIFDPENQQANPESPTEKVRTRLDNAIKTLESNKSAVSRWFWKALLAFNLVLWSLTLAIAFLRSW